MTRDDGVDRVPDPRGRGARTKLRFRMTAEYFATIRRDDITIVGADAVAAVFGTEQPPSGVS